MEEMRILAKKFENADGVYQASKALIPIRETSILLRQIN